MLQQALRLEGYHSPAIYCAESSERLAVSPSPSTRNHPAPRQRLEQQLGVVHQGRVRRSLLRMALKALAQGLGLP